MFNRMGIASIIALLIALGLILRFGKSSHFLLRDLFSGVNSAISDLSLQKFTGNTP